MKLNFIVDIGAPSVSIDNTPSPACRRLPFFTTSAGHYLAGKEYFTEREGLEDSHLLFYTIAGKGRLNYRGSSWDLTPGTAAVINCFEFQRYETAADEPWEFLWVHIGGANAGVYEERINAGSLSVVRLGSACETQACLSGILPLLQDRADRLADVKICILIANALTELACRAGQPSDSCSPLQREMDSALRYIEQNFDKISGIDEVVAATHMSKYHFIRRFKAHTGQSPYEYLSCRRIDAAKQLLREPGCKVSGAAHGVGFNDVNCFIRYFKKVTGVTPATYRKYYLF